MRAEKLLFEGGVWYGWPRIGMILPPDMSAFRYRRFKNGRQIGDDEEVWVLGNRSGFLTLLDRWNSKGGGTWTYVSV